MTPSMQYFVGKHVTIFTKPINRNFDEETLVKYFLGEVQSVDNTGILVKQLNCQRQSYFLWSSIVGVVEEETFDLSKPEDMAKVKEIVKPIFQEPLEKPASPYVDIKTIQEMARKARNN